MLQTNATVTRVAGASSGESFDGPAAPGADKWRDDDAPANAYLRERRDRFESPGGQTRVLDRVLLVETGNPPVGWRSGDTVWFSHHGDAKTATVRLVERRDIDDPDIDAELQTTRLTLEMA